MASRSGNFPRCPACRAQQMCGGMQSPRDVFAAGPDFVLQRCSDSRNSYLAIAAAKIGLDAAVIEWSRLGPDHCPGHFGPSHLVLRVT